MSTVCSKSNARSTTWTPLPDRFIDDHLVEMFPLFDQARLQLVDVTNLTAVHTLLQLPPNLAVDWVLRSELLAGHRAGMIIPVFHKLTDALSRVLYGQERCRPA